MSKEIENMKTEITKFVSPVVYLTEEEPKDLSVKRKFRPVPPPLDLSKRNLHLHHHDPSSQRSPLWQKNLPLRKRAYSWSSQPELSLHFLPEERHSDAQSTSNNSSNKHTNQSTTVSSGSLKICGLLAPHTPHTPHPQSAIPLSTTRFNFNESENVFCHSNELQLSGPLNLSTSSIGALPSSLLSPAPSQPSSCSLNSSREELETEPMITDLQIMSPSQHTSYPSSVSVSPRPINPADAIILPTSHHWPTSVWSIFLTGVQVHFVLGGGKITSAQLSDDLGQLESDVGQHYAPNGLHLLQTNIIEESILCTTGPNIVKSCQHYFRPIGIQQQDIMVIVPLDHPFFVRGKGWCSLSVDLSSQKYNIPCLQLLEGDVCLPPYHSEVSQTQVPVVTPDLTDAMKKFDFSDEMGGEVALVGTGCHLGTLARSVLLSPPASPSKKSKTALQVIGEHTAAVEHAVSGIGAKSRRPMNGFMLFAKQYRNKLIQQHPGKDNRAISVFLGNLWKSLPEQERESINRQARIQAEERKKVDPDCWKRKRSHSTSSLAHVQAQKDQSPNEPPSAARFFPNHV